MRLPALALVVVVICFVAKAFSADDTPNKPAAPPTQPAANPNPSNGNAPAKPVDSSKQIQAANAAISKANASVASANDAIEKATTYSKAIGDISGTAAKPSQSAIDNLLTLQATVAAIDQYHVLTALSTGAHDLDKAQPNTPAAALEGACGNLPDQPEVATAKASCDTAQKQVSAAQGSAQQALTKLQSAMQSIAPFQARQFDALTLKLKAFSDAKLIPSAAGGTPSDGGKAASDKPDAKAAADATAKDAAPPGSPSATILLQVLPKGLQAFQQVLADMGQYKATWNSMKPVLQSAAVGKPAAPPSANNGDDKGAADKTQAAGSSSLDADTELKTLQDAVDAIQKNLATWFPIVSQQLTADSQALDGKLSGLASDPAKNSADALGKVRDETETLSSAQSIVDAWPPLVGFLVDGQPQGFSLITTRKNLEDLQTATNTLRASVSRVHDALAGDLNDFETDQVSLYYFTDMPRLMYALNERYQTMGGVAEAKAQADAQRTALTQTELDLADAQATVNRYQKQVLDLQEQQRQANEKLKGLNSNVSKLASKLKQAQDNKNTADTEYQSAVDTQDSNAQKKNAQGEALPPDPTLAAKTDKAKKKQTAAATKVSDAQSNYDAAKTERDNAQTQADDAQNQKDSVPSNLAAAQQAMSDAQAAVSQQRRKMLLAAQAESDAFAFARDNTPFMFAPADASSSDPAKRVILYAFNDSKTVFMRGKPDDLAKVKRMIAVFDTPAPQARLTVWTFQLSADSGQKTNQNAAKQLNGSMEIVDQELGDTRALENTALTLLRDVINNEVTVQTGPVDLGCVDAIAGANNADCEKLSRLDFYDPLVLEQLNFSPTGNAGSDFLTKLRKLVPDPADTTTLGEALLVLSLANPYSRLTIREQFENRIRRQLSELPLNPGSWPNRPENKILALTWHALGVWDDGLGADESGLSSSQLEIVRALRASYDSSVLHEILDKLESWNLELRGSPKPCPAVPVQCPQPAGLYADLDTAKTKLAGYEDSGKKNLSQTEREKLSTLQLVPGTLSGDDAVTKARLTAQAVKTLPPADQVAYEELDRERLSLQSRLDTIKKQSVKVVGILKAYGIDSGPLLPPTAVPNTTGQKTDDSQRVLVVSAFAIGLLKKQILNYPGLTTASPRVAAADEMLKELIIAVEDDLAREFVQPMITRLRERLTSRSKVSVGVIQRESLLATNRGVARIDPRASAQLAVGDQEDILTGIQQLAQLYGTVQSGGALAALGALQQLPREPAPEIYSLNTGNRFQVTPIFDPSGQALRFKFDFVATSNVQEPNGTTNTQLSRIERHTINTEVQLSNLETREISRFEANARLGLPTTYWGGIPILKDIPYVRPWVPLVGWFVRKGGSNASAQQSVIFGQTTIYPTIGALVNLVSDPGIWLGN